MKISWPLSEPNIDLIKRSFRILSESDKKKIRKSVIFQISLNVLDLLGVTVIGILAALAVSSIESGTPGSRIQVILRYIGLSGVSFQTQVAILGVLAAIIFIVRTIFSIKFTKNILTFLSKKAADLSTQLSRRFFNQEITKLNAYSNQEILHAVTSGTTFVMLGIVSSVITLIADMSLLAIMTTALLIVDIKSGAATLVFFGLLGYLIGKRTHGTAGRLGAERSELTIVGNEKILEVLNSFREVIVRDRKDFYLNQIEFYRHKLANNNATMEFMPFISKYIIETSVILGSLIIGAIQFITKDATHAVATLAIFMAAGGRVAPAILRVQQSAIQLRGSLGMSERTIQFFEELPNESSIRVMPNILSSSKTNFVGRIRAENVNFKYPGNEKNSISNVSFTIEPGEVLAIVGPSGSGKSTLVDLILGVLTPETGKISISGLGPKEAMKNWPGKIAYVPQDVYISNTDISRNISLGFPDEESSLEAIERSVEIAQLSDFVKGLPLGLDTQLGEDGSRISGGQRQRVGIARALYTDPLVLVLDEATSALDIHTESEISQSIGKLKGQITVILIAHRLSTVRDADQVLYLDKGEIMASGSLSEVRKSVPSFDKQASMMGLTDQD